MDKQYKKVDYMGLSIDEVVRSLQFARDAKVELISTEFNGVTLYSDTVTLDDAYLQITGVTKEQFDNNVKEKREQWEREEREHKAKIPELTEYWIKQGNGILAEDKQKLWAECVPIRLDDLYKGMELKMCLDIIKILNTNSDTSFQLARAELNEQGHSGMSYSLVTSMICAFSDRGVEFVKTLS